MYYFKEKQLLLKKNRHEKVESGYTGQITYWKDIIKTQHSSSNQDIKKTQHSSTNYLFCLLKSCLSPSIKWYFPFDLNFHFIFLYFLMFLLPTCYNVYLFISLFVGFYMDKSDNSAASIRQKSRIKSLFIIIKYGIFAILGILELSLV